MASSAVKLRLNLPPVVRQAAVRVIVYFCRPDTPTPPQSLFYYVAAVIPFITCAEIHTPGILGHKFSIVTSTRILVDHINHWCEANSIDRTIFLEKAYERYPTKFQPLVPLLDKTHSNHCAAVELIEAPTSPHALEHFEAHVIPSYALEHNEAHVGHSQHALEHFEAHVSSPDTSLVRTPAQRPYTRRFDEIDDEGDTLLENVDGSAVTARSVKPDESALSHTPLLGQSVPKPKLRLTTHLSYRNPTVEDESSEYAESASPEVQPYTTAVRGLDHLAAKLGVTTITEKADFPQSVEITMYDARREEEEAWGGEPSLRQLEYEFSEPDPEDKGKGIARTEPKQRTTTGGLLGPSGPFMGSSGWDFSRRSEPSTRTTAQHYHLEDVPETPSPKPALAQKLPQVPHGQSGLRRAQRSQPLPFSGGPGQDDSKSHEQAGVCYDTRDGRGYPSQQPEFQHRQPGPSAQSQALPTSRGQPGPSGYQQAIPSSRQERFPTVREQAYDADFEVQYPDVTGHTMRLHTPQPSQQPRDGQQAQPVQQARPALQVQQPAPTSPQVQQSKDPSVLGSGSSYGFTEIEARLEAKMDAVNAQNARVLETITATFAKALSGHASSSKSDRSAPRTNLKPDMIGYFEPKAMDDFDAAHLFMDAIDSAVAWEGHDNVITVLQRCLKGTRGDQLALQSLG